MRSTVLGPPCARGSRCGLGLVQPSTLCGSFSGRASSRFLSLSPSSFLPPFSVLCDSSLPSPRSTLCVCVCVVRAAVGSPAASIDERQRGASSPGDGCRSGRRARVRALRCVSSCSGPPPATHAKETREKQLQAETNAMKEEIENVRSEIDALRKQLEGDEDGRNQFERARSQIEMAIEGMEVQADTLKKALSTAERANEQMQEENKTSAERCRETADKVYALMDALRLNQVELKKQEAENSSRDKKIASLERSTQNLQAKISMECDAKVLAEQERKEAEQEGLVLKKKNKKIEEAVTVAQAAQEKAEREIVGMNENVSSLQTQNAYLASRIDGQEEEKNAFKAEIRKVSDRCGNLVAENTRLRDEIDRIEEEVATSRNELDSYRKELEYIKREDVLDDAGRQRPRVLWGSSPRIVRVCECVCVSHGLLCLAGPARDGCMFLGLARRAHFGHSFPYAAVAAPDPTRSGFDFGPQLRSAFRQFTAVDRTMGSVSPSWDVVCYYHFYPWGGLRCGPRLCAQTGSGVFSNSKGAYLRGTLLALVAITPALRCGRAM